MASRRDGGCGTLPHVETEFGRIGVLLVNLGTPDAPTPRAVSRYLAEFLMDPRVIDLPALPRWLLVHLVIRPFRARRSARAYRAVWTDHGSPLLVHGASLAKALGLALGSGFRVELAMRYGEPSIAKAVASFVGARVSRIVAVPLFPQTSAAASGSALAEIYRTATLAFDVPPIDAVAEFFANPGFIAASHEVARGVLDDFRPDHVLFSYHGLPERHVRRSDPTGVRCFATPDCCAQADACLRRCYRAQCFATSTLLRDALALDEEHTTTAFQSRLGRTPWIGPQTEAVLRDLAASGVSRLAVMCPAFVADCLETIEEIGMRARERWLELGGKDFVLVPSLNAHPRWVEALAEIVRGRVS